MRPRPSRANLLRHTFALVSVSAAAALAAFVLPGYGASAQAAEKSWEAPGPTAAELEVRRAVEKGLRHLVSIQEDDGSWRCDVGYKMGIGMGSYQVSHVMSQHAGVTALCCMALIASGHTPENGEHSAAVRKGLNFVIRCADSFGQIKNSGERMYSHAFATLMLAEIYGTTGNREINRALRAAVEFIEKNQVGATENLGGWRYEPGQQDADMSITVCQLQALRAARNVGIKVREEVITRARAYIARNYYEPEGSFRYQPSSYTGRRTFALTAAGIVALQSAGNYESFRAEDGTNVDLRKAMRFLLSERPDNPTSRSAYSTPQHVCDFGFWYGHYYAAQAIRQFSNTDPRIWREWNDLNRTSFLRWQRPNGAWIDEIGGWDPAKNAYATAMACLILSIPNDYLPIFQH